MSWIQELAALKADLARWSIDANTQVVTYRRTEKAAGSKEKTIEMTFAPEAGSLVDVDVHRQDVLRLEATVDAIAERLGCRPTDVGILNAVGRLQTDLRAAQDGCGRLRTRLEMVQAAVDG